MPSWIASRWVKIAASVVALALVMVVVVIATHWPFTQGAVVQALEQTFASKVELQSFRVTYFAPGCVMEGVKFRRNGDPNAPAIAGQLTCTGSSAASTVQQQKRFTPTMCLS